MADMMLSMSELLLKSCPLIMGVSGTVSVGTSTAWHTARPQQQTAQQQTTQVANYFMNKLGGCQTCAGVSLTVCCGSSGAQPLWCHCSWLHSQQGHHQ